MKTIFTLLASSLIGISALAADIRPTSTVTIHSADNAKISVVLDGKRFEPGANGIVISGMTPGFHTVKVYKQKNQGLFNNRSVMELVYNGSVDIRTRTNLSISIGRSGNVTMNESRITGQARTGSGVYRYEDGGRWDDNYGVVNRAMGAREFNQALQSLQKEWLESNKVRSAVSLVRSEYLSTFQVTEIMRLFSFENNKLDVAKQAYQNTVDRQNYAQVRNMLTFANNKTELDRFIRNGRF